MGRLSTGKLKGSHKKTAVTILALTALGVSFFLFKWGKSAVYIFTRPMLGTVVNLTINADKQLAQNVSVEVFEEISRIEELMSPYRERSDVYRINKSAGEGFVEVGYETFELIKISKEISIESGGAFDISFAGLGSLWKTGSEDFIPPARERVMGSLHLVDSRNIELGAENRVRLLKRGMKIGLGAIAKGYAIRRSIEIMRSRGITSGIVEAGGDLQVIGNKYGKPWIAGIRNPRENSLAFAVALADGDSIVTSGDYERFSLYRGKRYHHIIDPRSGFPTETFSSVTVIHRNPTLADAYSTSLFVMGYDRSVEFLKKNKDVSAVLIGLNMKVHASSRLKGRIESLDEMNVSWVE